MKSMIRKSVSAAVGIGFSLLVSSIAQAAPVSADMPVEKGEFRIGIEPWLGYGQWHIAAEKKLFKKNGLGDVKLVNFSEDKDINGALASGNIDAANIATHTAMAMASAGLPVKIVLLLDESLTADALIVDPKLKSISDLKGKQVAFEEGTTSNILLFSALNKAGMSLSDVVPVPMAANAAGTALIAGRVPAAVTYEPYLTIAGQQGEVNMLYSGKDDPGIISDVFVVRSDVLDKKPGQIIALLKTWEDSLAYYKAHEKEGRSIISRAVGASPEELETAFNGVHYYTLADSVKLLDGEFTNTTYQHIEKAASQAGLLPAPVKAEDLIDSRFVDAFSK